MSRDAVEYEEEVHHGASDVSVAFPRSAEQVFITCRVT